MLFRWVFKTLPVMIAVLLGPGRLSAQEEMWDKTSSGRETTHIKWFKEAKFGLFIHWGLYSRLGGAWNGKRYYGSGEWIMSQARIPAAEYAKTAAAFNPVNFNADEWAALAKDAGARYMVITAKHHEGFAMYDSKVSDFNIVQATPYKRDPMKALAAATRKRGIQFGFYYSQFLDWHEPDGGGNKWDFDESKKQYLSYYKNKSIPQLKELLSNYGPLGIVWFDMPGGLSKEQTRQLVDSLRLLQPGSLFSSRVGQGLGDYKDFGDSEIPAVPIEGAWESIYTHNDTWGYISHDMDFKSSGEIIRLLAAVASRGGNLMLNVGPDGNGNIPPYSIKYLRSTGNWLKQNGESIYGTGYGFIPAQPWGVTTSKPGKLFLHVFERPANGRLLLPGFAATVSKAYALVGGTPVAWRKKGMDVYIDIPPTARSVANTVFVVEYKGKRPAYDSTAPAIVSAQFAENRVEAVQAQVAGNAMIKSITYSYYYGDWKHAVCISGMKAPQDTAGFSIRITDPGDYRIILEYACPAKSSRQEGIVRLNGRDYMFQTLRTSEYDSHQPLVFIRHAIGITTIRTAGLYRLGLHTMQEGEELFKLKTVILEPVQ